jgi:hypothetical protein
MYSPKHFKTIFLLCTYSIIRTSDKKTRYLMQQPGQNSPPAAGLRLLVTISSCCSLLLPANLSLPAIALRLRAYSRSKLHRVPMCFDPSCKHPQRSLSVVTAYGRPSTLKRTAIFFHGMRSCSLSCNSSLSSSL